jgi:hypothetical protein
MKTIKAYKLFTSHKDGSIASLFINKRRRIPFGVWLQAETIPTNGFAVRRGWHCTKKKSAPHLSKKGRTWCLVEIEGVTEFRRPASQGGLWYLAERMRVVKKVEDEK